MLISEEIAVADDYDDHHGDAHQGRDGVDRQRQGFRNEVADQQQGGAREHRSRHEDAVVGAGEEHACQVRDGQPDEAHGAAEGGDGTGQQYGGEEQQRTGALHVEPHRAGIVFAQQQQVERLDGGDAEHEPRGDDGEHQGEVAARDVAQRPHRPDDERLERRLARQVLEYLDYGADARAEHHAQDEDDHDVLDAAADRHHDQQHECRAEPCRAGDAERLHERVRRDAQQGSPQQEQRYAQPGARADAQHIGPGQRVAEKGLHLQAAGGERRAGQECRDGFEQPYPQDDVPYGGVAVAACERRPDVGGRHGDRADQEVGCEEHHGQQRKRREEECGSAGCHLAVLEFEGGFVTYVDGDAVGRAGRPPGGFLQGVDGEDFIALPHHGDAVVERIGLGIPAGNGFGAVAVCEAVERTPFDDSVAVREVAEPRFRARGRRLQPEQGREEYCEPLHYSSRL